LERLWIGIKYILFGTPQKYGHYEEILLSLDSIKELKKFIDSSIEQGNLKIESIVNKMVVVEKNQNP
jgi:putative aminopeptidase FrvX